MNHSLKIRDEAKERIRRAIGMMEAHYQKLPNAHSLREIMKVEVDVGRLLQIFIEGEASRQSIGKNNKRHHR
jgi:predicted type IV restriction endonuclease